MRLPELLEEWAARSLSVLTPSPVLTAMMLIPWTIPLLMRPVTTEEVPRGFASSADPAICYWAWSDGTNFTFTIRCTCGLIKPIHPDQNGKCYYEHVVPMCGWRVELELEGYGRITETKEERNARRKQEAESRESL